MNAETSEELEQKIMSNIRPIIKSLFNKGFLDKQESVHLLRNPRNIFSIINDFEERGMHGFLISIVECLDEIEKKNLIINK